MTKPTIRTTEEAEAAAAERWLDQLDPATVHAHDATHVRAIVAAADGLVAAERKLHQSVAEARAAGDSWTVIGAALGTTRQAAQMRFRDAGKHTEEKS